MNFVKFIFENSRYWSTIPTACTSTNSRSYSVRSYCCFFPDCVSFRVYKVLGPLRKTHTTPTGSHRTVQIYTIIYVYDRIAYEWDEAKRLANLSEHKLDFEDAWRVYEATDKVTYQSLYLHEERWIDLAEVEGVVLLLVYTMRGETVRCISFRRARRGRERRIYHG